MAKYKILPAADTDLTEVTAARNTRMVTLIGPDDEAPNFATRRFVIGPGGRIPAHSHPDLEHEQVVISGTMHIVLDGQERTVGAGDAIFIPVGTVHSYENTGDTDAEFICVIPSTDGYQTDWHEPSAT